MKREYDFVFLRKKTSYSKHRYDTVVDKTNEEERELIDRCRSIADTFYETLQNNGYVNTNFKRCSLDTEGYFLSATKNGEKETLLGIVEHGGKIKRGGYSSQHMYLNMTAIKSLIASNNIDKVAIIIFHELLNLEETTLEKTTGARELGNAESSGGRIFNKGLANVKALRLFQKAFNRQYLQKEQISSGFKTASQTDSLITQVTGNLINVLGLDIDELIKDGINNKENHRANIIEHFKNAGVSFIADISPPFEKMYELIYKSRKRDLTQLEKVELAGIINKIQNTTKGIYNQKHPNATKEEKAAFAQNFIDTSKTYTQTKFLCELCGIEPERANREQDKTI